jgi:hypothetical protein
MKTKRNLDGAHEKVDIDLDVQAVKAAAVEAA